MGSLLGGSWVVISRGISRVTILITHIKGLLTPLITTHEPPSRQPMERTRRRTVTATAIAEAAPGLLRVPRVSFLTLGVEGLGVQGLGV